MDDFANDEKWEINEREKAEALDEEEAEDFDAEESDVYVDKNIYETNPAWPSSLMWFLTNPDEDTYNDETYDYFAENGRHKMMKDFDQFWKSK